VVHRLGRCQLGAQAAGSSLALSLAAATGLPKSSAYRLAEHLAVLGVVQRVNHRYHIEAGISPISRSAFGLGLSRAVR
jgi:DNA-binding IclR family transcriptional regulator